MNDVTAVILTIGESTTQRAIESVKGQSLRPYDIIVIDHVSPFHRAMTHAIEKVRSTFFVQVDADMILDRQCFAHLRQCMDPQVGLVVGHLRDPLIQRVVGIKMYRTACLQRVTFQDSISPDTDVQKAIVAQGWSSVRALNYSRSEPWSWHTFGQHQPDYTPHYTFSKFLLEGRRHRYRDHLQGFKNHLARLQKSNMDVALIGQVALARGLLSEELGDGLKPFVVNDEWREFEKFLHSPPGSRLSFFTIGAYLLLSLYRPYFAFSRLGNAMRQAKAVRTFHQTMQVLNKINIKIGWLPIVGLSNGIISCQSGKQYRKQAAKFFDDFKSSDESVGIVWIIRTLLTELRTRIS